MTQWGIVCDAWFHSKSDISACMIHGKRFPLLCFASVKDFFYHFDAIVGILFRWCYLVVYYTIITGPLFFSHFTGLHRGTRVCRKHNLVKDWLWYVVLSGQVQRAQYCYQPPCRLPLTISAVLFLIVRCYFHLMPTSVALPTLSVAYRKMVGNRQQAWPWPYVDNIVIAQGSIGVIKRKHVPACREYRDSIVEGCSASWVWMLIQTAQSYTHR